MGTRSTIALEYADGTVDQIYCHWDGYLDHNGAILRDHYTDPFKVQKLMELGSISSLGANIGQAHPFSKFEINKADPDFDKLIALHELADKEGWTTFYARDRGELGVGAKRFKDFEDYKANHQYEEYEYILRQVDGKAVWFVSAYNGYYRTLAEAFVAEAAEREEEEAN
jgi:hypothetical protein